MQAGTLSTQHISSCSERRLANTHILLRKSCPGQTAWRPDQKLLHGNTLSPYVFVLCSNTYSALNALAGHYNSFGATAPIPKKRLDRLTKVRP